jgi:hypothetical protein
MLIGRPHRRLYSREKSRFATIARQFRTPGRSDNLTLAGLSVSVSQLRQSWRIQQTIVSRKNAAARIDAQLDSIESVSVEIKSAARNIGRTSCLPKWNRHGCIAF